MVRNECAPYDDADRWEHRHRGGAGSGEGRGREGLVSAASGFHGLPGGREGAVAAGGDGGVVREVTHCLEDRPLVASHLQKLGRTGNLLKIIVGLS